MDWLLGIAVIMAVMGLGYCAVASWVWTSMAGAVLVLVTCFHAVSWPFLVILWVIWAFMATFMHVPSVRQRFLSTPVAHFVKRQMPPISETEQAAIDAGDVWWEAAIMRGAPQWEEVEAFPLATLTPEEAAFLNNQVNTLCAMIDPWQQGNAGVHADDVWAYLKKERFFSMLIPKTDGGLGFSAYAQSCVVSKIATRDISTAVTVMVPNSLGPGELILHYGTPEQKAYYLPRLASGEDVPCFGLTAPEAGSDAGGMLDYGVICESDYQGQRTLGIKLTFEKRYITLAPVASVVGLAFKCVDPNQLLGGAVERGITLCLLPADQPGLTIGERHHPIGSAFPNGTLRGQDVFIPLSAVIGGEVMIGQGWRMLMECLAAGRGISLPALATAASKLSYIATASYARVRKQFKVSIAEFEGVQGPMAEIGAFTYLLEAMRTLAASAITSGVKPAVVSAISKYHMTELGRLCTMHAMDIHGGKGIMLGPLNYLANAYITMPVAITVEGANILTRNLIIFGQGAIRCHPFLLKEMSLALAPQLNVADFDAILTQHIKYTVDHAFKTMVLGLTGGHVSRIAPGLGFGAAQRAITRMSHALALTSDISFLVLGGKLKRKEFLSARLGDVLSYLYMATCMIKYAAMTPGAPKATSQFAVDYCLYRVQVAFDAFFENFTPRWIGKLLRMVVFPWGRAYTYPADKMAQSVVKEMMDYARTAPIWKTFYFPADQTGLGAVIKAAEEEKSLHDALRTVRHFKNTEGVIVVPQTLRDKINAAHHAGVISDADKDRLYVYATWYENAIGVDAFST